MIIISIFIYMQHKKGPKPVGLLSAALNRAKNGGGMIEAHSWD